MLESKLQRYLDHDSFQSSPLSELLPSPPGVPALEDAIAPCHGEWVISQDLARLLAQIVLTYKPRNILEFGAGSSSRILARSLALLGRGQLTSLEQNPQWCQAAWHEIKTLPEVDCKLLHAIPRLRWSVTGLHYMFWGQRHEIQKRGAYDLVLVDSPQYFFGREGAMPLIYAHLQPKALIILDDAARLEEQGVLWRWLHAYPGLRLLYFDAHFGLGKGIGILQLEKHQAPQGHPLSWISNLGHLIYLFLQCPDFWRLRRQELAPKDA